MVSKKNFILLSLLILFSCIVYDKMVSPSYPFRYEKVQINIKHLRPGMILSDVELLVGNPKKEQQFISVDKQIKEIIWILHFDNKSANKIPVLTFDLDNKKLIKIEKLTKDEVVRKLD